MGKYDFQVCQKIIVFSKDKGSILLCKRKGEADYDGVFSFIGGKMEVIDDSILDGLKREKNEEVGKDFKINIFPTYSANLFFVKKDGSRMVLPHYYAVHESGSIVLSDEYSEYRWVSIDDVDVFEPKIATIPDMVRQIMCLQSVLKNEESFFI